MARKKKRKKIEKKKEKDKVANEHPNPSVLIDPHS